MLAKIRQEAPAIQSFWARFNYTEYAFFLLTLPVLLLSLHPENTLWRSGIEIPLQSLGALPGGSAPKLFFFEIYQGLVGILVAAVALARIRDGSWRTLGKNILQIKTYLVLLLFFIFLAHFFLAERTQTMLFLRNGAFLWYLALPLAISTLGLRKEVFEAMAKLVLALAFLIFCYSSLESFLLGSGRIPMWMPQVGLYGILLVFLRQKFRKAFVIPIFLGLGLSGLMHTSLQRTSLLGMISVFVALLLVKQYRKKLFAFCALLFLSTILFFQTAPLAQKLLQPNKPSINEEQKQFSSPLQKAESNSSGMEIFRSAMWGDAWGLFLEQPLWGISFEKQVVYRIYKYAGIFVPNDEHWFKTPGIKDEAGFASPISGPHNSYLNALARIGVWALLIPLLHLLCLFTLWYHGAYYACLLFFAQSFYAIFNVGLEGPIRSALLLICMGLALTLRTPSLREMAEKFRSLAFHR